MLKFAVLVLGFLTVVTIAPSARSTNFQNDRTQSDVNGQLHAEKLVPIKKSVKLAPTVMKGTSVPVPIDRKVEMSPENKERQRIKTACQREFDDRNQFKSNERAVGMFENSTTASSSNNFANSNNFNSSVNQGSCGFSIPF